MPRTTIVAGPARPIWLPMVTHVMVNLLFSLLLIAAYLEPAS
jgi:hypothetical protein